MSNSIATYAVSFAKCGLIMLISVETHGDHKKKCLGKTCKRQVTQALFEGFGDGHAHSDDGTNSNPLLSKPSALSSSSSCLAAWAFDP